jgi:hypothetical protein
LQPGEQCAQLRGAAAAEVDAPHDAEEWLLIRPQEHQETGRRQLGGGLGRRFMPDHETRRLKAEIPLAGVGPEIICSNNLGDPPEDLLELLNQPLLDHFAILWKISCRHHNRGRKTDQDDRDDH